MENPTLNQHVTLDPARCPAWAKGLTFTVEFVRPTKRDVVVVSTDDAREGKGHMRRLDRVPFDALTEAK